MGDRLRDAGAGPDGMFATDREPSRGQHETISRLAGELLGFDLGSRYDASVAIVRLRKAISNHQGQSLPAAVEPF